MNYKTVFPMLFFLFLGTANANWIKISDVDYTWGAFNIYHISLFTETGKYVEGTRPLMLTLQYKKPWAGRDFAVSLARTWNKLNIKLPENEVNEVINRLRKTFPDIKPEDTLHYIALEDRGYFILNNKVVSETFSKEFSDAIAAVWLDLRMDISRQLLKSSDNSDENGVKGIEQQIPDELELEAKATDTNIAVESSIAQEVSENITPAETEAVPHESEVAANMESVNNTDDENSSELNTEQAEEGKIENTQSVEQKVVQQESKDEPKKTGEKIEDRNIESPEIFISPIYDDFLMLFKPCS